MAKSNDDVTYICAVSGVLGRVGKVVGMCGKIGCCTDVCHSSKPCKHKTAKAEDNGKE